MDLVPSWNLDMVLRHLSRTPFEPLRLLSIRDHFSCACNSPEGERDPSPLTQDKLARARSFGLHLPEFIAKTDTEAHATLCEFCIKSLASLVGPEDEERLLPCLDAKSLLTPDSFSYETQEPVPRC
ncbi:hypothetical protein E2C01_080655 [Portunus trituberculatus]|uniref:Uncharacterized protein n=1 Tax=Portunus trituberculatus TaxID=210409 RepID=A0A5B7IWP8_PORTR|nr:hypothetical protein [Portunus trituberculatus]